MTTEWSAQVENERKMAAQNLGARSARKEGSRKTLLLRPSRRTAHTLLLLSFYELNNKHEQKDKRKTVRDKKKNGEKSPLEEGALLALRFRRSHSSLVLFFASRRTKQNRDCLFSSPLFFLRAGQQQHVCTCLNISFLLNLLATGS